MTFIFSGGTIAQDAVTQLQRMGRFGYDGARRESFRQFLINYYTPEMEHFANSCVPLHVHALPQGFHDAQGRNTDKILQALEENGLQNRASDHVKVSDFN
jgi:hypothetical protein